MLFKTFLKMLRYLMYSDYILYRMNEWSHILNQDIIFKLLSNKNTQTKAFSEFDYCEIDELFVEI